MAVQSRMKSNVILTQEKLAALRALMKAHPVDGYLVPSADAHLNEYVPAECKRRDWISGFTGSVGDFFITQTEAWVFVDSRYYEQADQEVETRWITVSKLGLENQPTLSETIRNAARGQSVFRLGLDPQTISMQQFQAFQKAFRDTSVQLVPISENLVDPLWGESRPKPVKAEIFALPIEYAGQSVEEKLNRVRQAMQERTVDVLPLTKLDQIAWLFNLRGADVAYNPLFIAYGLITENDAFLFVDQNRIRPLDREDLERYATLKPYDAYGETLKSSVSGKRVLLDPKGVSCETLQWVEQAGGDILEADSPVELMKAVKNPTEIHWMKEANLRASRAKVRALCWLDQQLKAREAVTEASFAEKLEAFYAEEPGFMGLSFNTISGAGANSSIVHYGTPNPKKKLLPGELFLIDSGAQYLGGTTDDTRTLIIGKPTALQKRRFTEVLKAHINCASQQFPKGTEGIRLDGITRANLWNAGLNYGHGTGHGVGAFLNVHEGPNGIHARASKAFEPGMVTSIEPGYYEPGWGGIRLENLYFVKELSPGWYGFESLIYIPFDKRLMNKAALSPEQLRWLKRYHQAILRKLKPTLSPEEQRWLENACRL